MANKARFFFFDLPYSREGPFQAILISSRDIFAYLLSNNFFQVLIQDQNRPELAVDVTLGSWYSCCFPLICDPCLWQSQEWGCLVEYVAMSGNGRVGYKNL